MDDISLTKLLGPQDVPALDMLSRRKQFTMLLTGEVGPLKDLGIAYTQEEVAAAYFCWTAFMKRADSGMMGSRPTYEVWNLIQTRLQLALRRAKSLGQLPGELLRPLGLDPLSALTVSDRYWVLTACSDTDGAKISRLRSRESQASILTAAQLMQTWFWDLRDLTSTSDQK